MIRVCYSRFHIGNRVFGEKEPFDNKNETGGLCSICRILEKLCVQKFRTKKWFLNWIKKIEIREEEKQDGINNRLSI